MNDNIIRVALEFLKRVQLTGAEVEAYVAVVNALQSQLETEDSDDL